MSAPETVELRERADEQLLQDLEEAHQALFNLRFQAATRQLADVSQVRKTRRTIARIKTLLTEREIIAEADRLIAAETAAETAETAEATGEGAAADAAPAGGVDESDEVAAEGDEAAKEADDAAEDGPADGDATADEDEE